MAKGKLLIVDDNQSVLAALQLMLQREFEEIHCLKNPNQLMSTLQKEKIDLVLLDMNFKAGMNTGNEGIYWLKEIKKQDADIEVIMLTAYGDVELAVKALQQGATDFVLKPWDNNKLKATLQAALKIRLSNLKVKELKVKEDSLKQEINKDNQLLLGTSKPMLKLKQLIAKVAKTDANILLTGENGTGKAVIAQEIHRQSVRSKELMVTVDISSLPETLIESELFGHKKGAFTDAQSDRIGKFQLAHHGVLFLDEIGNIPIQLQSKLLVALQNRAIIPVGGNQETPIDIRLICATNADIHSLVEQKQFREDLLYRINTIHIEIPPLRERGEDIELLANFFLKKFAAKYQKEGLKLGAQALKKLQKYHWPGNVRELEHSMEKAVILCDSKTVGEDSFLFRRTPSKSTSSPVTLEEIEKQVILEALDRHEGNYSSAAKQLGITRQTLYNKVKRFDD